MGSLTRLIVFVISIFVAITLKSNSQYLLPITKHEPTNHFYTTLNLGTPAAISPLNLLLDLETNLTLLNCDKIKTPIANFVTCQSTTCKSIPGSGCIERALCLYQQSSLLVQNVAGAVVQDAVNISTTDGGRFLSQVSVHPFTFACSGGKPFQVLPPPVSGILSLSPESSSFTKQVTSFFKLNPKFSLCLPSSGTGHFYIAADHYFIPPFSSDYPITMKFTPLKQIDSGNYIINVTAIYVNGFSLPLKPNLLARGAKLSTVVPYTLLHTDIYNALAQSFTRKAKKVGIYKVPAIAPFKDCYDARHVVNGTAGLIVPLIQIGVLQGSSDVEVKWGFFGANSVVKVTETVMCLAFLDGGNKPKELIVVGTHQLQDFMLEIDLSTSLLGFSDSLLLHNSSCSTWPSQK